MVVVKILNTDSEQVKPVPCLLQPQLKEEATVGQRPAFCMWFLCDAAPS